MFSPELAVKLAQIRKSAAERHIPVLREESEPLLFDWCARVKPQKILEIGTAVGYSAILMLTAAPQCRVLNTVEIDDARVFEARRNLGACGMLSRVNFFVGDACQIVPKLSGSYDFIFLDGPKGQYAAFLPYLLELLPAGGVLVADNVGYFGLAAQAQTLPKRHKHITIARNLTAFTAALTQNPRLRTEFFNVGDGMSHSIKL